MPYLHDDYGKSDWKLVLFKWLNGCLTFIKSSKICIFAIMNKEIVCNRVGIYELGRKSKPGEWDVSLGDKWYLVLENEEGEGFLEN